MPDHPLSLKGPGAFGVKVENRIRLGQELKTSFAIGLCKGRASVGNSQSAKSFQGNIKKKINKSNRISAQGSIMWLGNNRTIQLELSHQQSITPETTLTTRMQYSNKGPGVIN